MVVMQERRTRDFETVREEISARADQISPQMRHIAEFALQHPNEVAFGTVAAIAKKANVQPSSLVRFAKLFGFEGYSDLQQVFRTRLINTSFSYHERVQRLRHADSGGEHLLSQFVGSGIAALENLNAQTSGETLAAAVDLLRAAANIFVIGQGRAFPVAAYLSYALTRFNRLNILLDNVGGSAERTASLAEADDVLIAVSFAPYSPGTIEIAKQAVAAGVIVIGITDGPLSPLAQAASVTFEVERDADQPFRSLVAPMCIAQVLVLSLGEAIATPRKRTRRNG